MTPLYEANGCVGATTVTSGTSSKNSLCTDSGSTGNEPTMPIWQVPCSTGSMTAPSTSTNSRNGGGGNLSRNLATASINSLMGYITSIESESSGSSPSRKVFARALKPSI